MSVVPSAFRGIVLLLLSAWCLVPSPTMAAVSLGAWIQHSPDDITVGNIPGLLTLTGNDATATATMPFGVTIGGTSYSTIVISTNGWIEFGSNTQGTADPTNASLPTSKHTNPFLAAYWDDLQVFGTNIRYGFVGTSPHRTYIIDYQADVNPAVENGGDDDMRFQVQIHETSALINVHYDSTGRFANGNTATIGFQTAGGSGATAFPLTFDGKVLDDNRPNEGWSIDLRTTGAEALAAHTACSPDDIGIDTPAFTTLSGNDSIAGVTLPFSVTIEGTSYTTITIGTNGLIQFGTLTGANPTANAGIPSSSFPGPTLFWFWDDIQTEGTAIRYGTVGTNPNRTFIVDFQANRVGATGDKVNGQVQIHQGSNLISVKYRDPLSNPNNGQNATIGFQGAGGASAQAYPLTFNGKILDDNRPDEGFSVHAQSTKDVSLHARSEYSPDDIASGAFTSTLTGDNAIAGVTLLFSVVIDGVSYNTITIGTNGLVQFGTLSGANPTTNTALPSASFTGPTLFWYWDDLQPFSSNIRHGMVGASPNRTYIIDFQENRVGDTGNVINGQVQIHEGSNQMNVKYRSTMSAGANAQSATIGFQGAGGASATVYPLTFNGKILDDNIPDAGWSVSPRRYCGDGLLQSASPFNEQCDLGALNGAANSCCTASCQFASNSTPCRPAAGLCDAVEMCTGSSTTCPADANLPILTPCRPALNECDLGEVCTGLSPACPADIVVVAGTPCTDDGNQCTSDSCNGTTGAPACVHPPQINGFPCSGNGVGECTGVDTCDGAGSCSDNDTPAGTQCTDLAGPALGNCKDAQCNGLGACDQIFANEVDGTACFDAVFCNGNDQCSGGFCIIHDGDPCPGPDGDADCSESCNELNSDCTGNDSNGSPCDNGSFCDGTETCDGAGACGSSTGDPCPGPDGDVNCAESCDETNNNCLANDLDGTLCRPAADLCDAFELCNAGACPADVFIPSGTICEGGSGDVCDPHEVCDGASAACPSDSVAPIGTVCNAGSGDICDPAEVCSGVADQPCPSDTVSSAGTVCNPGSGDVCDPAEVCSGTADDPCPADSFQPNTFECRSVTVGDVCDEAETCTGAADQPCPADGFQPNTVECRGVTVGDVCDEPEFCTGSGPACPADAVKPNTEECRPSQGVCDIADSCDGIGKQCTNDVKEPASTECRASAGDCDVAENCDGLSDACPADGFQPSTVSCRAPTPGELCDEEEFCTGSGANCPADVVTPSGTVCRPGTDLCDAEETCSGLSKFCPADGVEPNTTLCRPATGTCDIAENCDGAGTACPADAFQISGTACGSNGNSDCDNPDTCNGSGTCLVNNEANGTSCDDSNTCTSGEACQAGVCSGGTDLCPDLDHYKCYQGKDLKNPKFIKQLGVETDDQLVIDEFVDVKKLKFVCAPVDKNGEGINSPSQHLACYQLKAPKFVTRPKVEVSTQFQTSTFELKKAKLLCLPATKTIIP